VLSYPTYTGLLLCAAMVLVLLNASFVAAEFAIIKVRKTRLEELAKQGNKRARSALRCSENIALTLSSTQLGITLTSLGLGWIGENAFAQALTVVAPTTFAATGASKHIAATIASFFLITLMHVVLGELVPKSIALHETERIALLLARPLRIFYKCSRPLILLFDYLAALVLSILGYEKTEEEPFSEQELKIVMKESRKDGVISAGEALIISRAFEFADKRAIDIMVPREKVEFISMKRHILENMNVITGRQHTRFPLCDGDFDNVIGVVRTKDVWPDLLVQLSNAHFSAKCDAPIVITQHMRQDHLLQLFQTRRAHQAIVRNDVGRNIGIVTLEDVLEHLVGFFPD
jgi:CBS domain containing-hemolysin-like protein